MTTFVTRHMAAKSIWHVRNENLTYLRNPKVGCSTIQKSLWLWADERRGQNTYRGDPHSHSDTPFLPSLQDASRLSEEVVNSSFFTVVRNPYVRLLSGYLNKIPEENRDLFAWQTISRRFGLGGEAKTPSFAEFVALITSEDHPCLMEQHFAPQHVAVLSNVVTPDFIGHLEDMVGLAEWLSGHGVKIDAHSPHATGAAKKLREYYTDQEIELVRNWYADDFEYFGYSDDIDQIAPVRPAYLPDVDRKVLDCLLRVWCEPTGGARKLAYEELKSLNPALDLDYVVLESDILELPAIMKMAKRVIDGEITNWRFMAKIGQELARRDAIRPAAQVLGKTERVMYYEARSSSG